jgi:alcohol dehydrogenase YqhD (iron-dependent ADH family)
MNNFYYQIPTEIYFGKGQIKHLGESIKKYGKRVLFIYGGGSIKRMGLDDTIKSILEQNGIEAIRAFRCRIPTPGSNR